MTTDMTTIAKGFYTYRTRNFDGSYNLVPVYVEVVGETSRSYRVRLLQPVDGYQPGRLMTVRRHNVRLCRPEPQPRHDCSPEW